MDALVDGMIVKCLSCGEPIEVNKKTMILSWDGAYLTCNKCKKSLSVSSYLRRGEIISK